MYIKRLFNLLFKRKTFKKAASFFDRENIKGFIQGHLREMKKNYGTLDEHILEQAAWRMTQANIECVEADQCLSCGCFPMSDKMLEDRSCQENCYPPMMSKSDWEVFKDKNKIQC